MSASNYVDASSDVILRQYQQNIVDDANAIGNSILFMPTGSGKTVVASTLIRSWLQKDPRKIAILAPNRALLDQIANNISRLINSPSIRSVLALHGNCGAEKWTTERWQQELEAHRIIAATPQSFVNLLSAGLVLASDFAAWIFDEAHHATQDHPYAVLMKSFYAVCEPVESRPRILGLSASPVKNKRALMSNNGKMLGPAALRDRIFQEMSKLEETLRATCITTMYAIPEDELAEPEVILQECGSSATEKACTILALVKRYAGTNPSVLVFARKRVEVYELTSLLRSQCGRSSPLVVECFVGETTKLESSHPGVSGQSFRSKRSMQDAALMGFRKHDVNILVCTDVLEEGIDVPVCHMVVHTNLPPTPKAMLQCAGRARAKNGIYVQLHDVGSASQDAAYEHIFLVDSLKEAMRSYCHSFREERSLTTNNRTLESLEGDSALHRVDASNATLFQECSVPILYRFLQSVFGNRVPIEWTKEADGSVTLHLSGSLAELFQESQVAGESRKTVAFHLCKRLLEKGMLSPSLKPAAGVTLSPVRKLSPGPKVKSDWLPPWAPLKWRQLVRAEGSPRTSRRESVVEMLRSVLVAGDETMTGICPFNVCVGDEEQRWLLVIQCPVALQGIPLRFFQALLEADLETAGGQVIRFQYAASDVDCLNDISWDVIRKYTKTVVHELDRGISAEILTSEFLGIVPKDVKLVNEVAQRGTAFVPLSPELEHNVVFVRKRYAADGTRLRHQLFRVDRRERRLAAMCEMNTGSMTFREHFLQSYGIELSSSQEMIPCTPVSDRSGVLRNVYLPWNEQLLEVITANIECGIQGACRSILVLLAWRLRAIERLMNANISMDLRPLLQTLLGSNSGIDGARLLTRTFTLPQAVFPHVGSRMSYQSLEFVGDRVLNLVVALEAFMSPDTLPEALMSELRTCLVRNRFLSAVARETGLLEAATAYRIGEGEATHARDADDKVGADVVESLLGCMDCVGDFLASYTFVSDALKLVPSSLLDLSELCLSQISSATPVQHVGELQCAEENLKLLEDVLQYTFSSRLLGLAAVTHKSSRALVNCTSRTYGAFGCTNFDRLEFLGDALLDYMFVRMICRRGSAWASDEQENHAFHAIDHLGEGAWTNLRTHLVSNPVLIRVCICSDLHRTIITEAVSHVSILMRIAEREEESQGGEADPARFLSSMYSVSEMKVFADVVEAVIAAVWIDSGLDFAAAANVLHRLYTLAGISVPSLYKAAVGGTLPSISPVSVLLEKWAQLSTVNAHYRLVGQELSPGFEYAVVDEPPSQRSSGADMGTQRPALRITIGRSTCSNAKTAKLRAARSAIPILERLHLFLASG